MACAASIAASALTCPYSAPCTSPILPIANPSIRESGAGKTCAGFPFSRQVQNQPSGLAKPAELRTFLSKLADRFYSTSESQPSLEIASRRIGQETRATIVKDENRGEERMAIILVIAVMMVLPATAVALSLWFPTGVGHIFRK